jgi:hypothetical protein
MKASHNLWYALVGLTVVLAACGGSSEGNQPTTSPIAPSIVVETVPERPHEADLSQLRDSSEVEQLRTVNTLEGDVPSKETIDDLAATFPLVAGYVMRPLGSWLPYGSENDAGETEYVRFVSESRPKVRHR